MTRRPGQAIARGSYLARAVAGRARRRKRLAASVVAVAIAAAALGGCASARSELGTANSNCYIDVASALHAVQHEGRLHGIRLVTVASLRPHATLLYRAARSAKHRPSEVCLVAFEGKFTASHVVRSMGRRSGHYAVVEFSYPGRGLLATLLTRSTPIPFGHPHI